MNEKKKQFKVLKIVAVMMMVMMAVSAVFPIFAEEAAGTTAAPETVTGNGKTQIKFEDLSENKVGAEPYNRTNPGMFFSKTGEGRKAKYGFFVRVEEDTIAELYENYTSFDRVAIVEFLYREKPVDENDIVEWKSGRAEIIDQTKKTDEENGKEYIYFTLDAYSGGMKDLTPGKDYQIILEFYELTDTPVNRQVCSTDVMEIYYSSQMKDSWRGFFAEKAGVELNDKGEIDTAICKGLFDYIKYPMGLLMKLFYNLTSNYLLAIFLFAIVIKIVLFPTGIKQQKNMVKQAHFSPKQRAIMNKYKGRTDRETQMKMQSEIQEAQQKEGISMMGGGCLPMILQMIILISLYGVIREPLTFLSGVSIDAMKIIVQYFTDIKGVTSTLNDINVIGYIAENFEEVTQFLSSNFDFTFTNYIENADALPNFVLFKGFNMADTPNIKSFNILLVIPVLVFFSYYYSMKITRKLSYQPPKMDGAPDMAMSMKIMDLTMPAMSAFICFSVPSMLGIYWIFQSLIGIVQQYILKKMYPFPVFTEEDYKAAEREYKGKQPKAKKTEYEKTERKKGAVTKYDDEDEEYAVLEDKVSYYDLPKSEREKLDNKNNKKEAPKKTGMIEKSEMDDGSKGE